MKKCKELVVNIGDIKLTISSANSVAKFVDKDKILLYDSDDDDNATMLIVNLKEEFCLDNLV